MVTSDAVCIKGRFLAPGSDLFVEHVLLLLGVEQFPARTNVYINRLSLMGRKG